MTKEDYQTYTEVDIGANRIQVISATQANIVSVDRDETVYLYKDYGVDYFGDFVVTVDVLPVAYGSTGRAIPWGLGNTLDQLYGVIPSIYVRFKIATAPTPDDIQWGIYEITAGPTTTSDKFAESWHTNMRYLTVTKSGTDLQLDVYSDAARTNLLGTASITLHADHKFRYSYGLSSEDRGQSGGVYLSFNAFNLEYIPAISSASENLLGKFIVSPAISQGSENLHGRFISRQSASQDLNAGFDGQTSVDFPGEFIARHETSVDLYVEFEVGQGSVDLLGKLIVHELIGSVDLLGEFAIKREATVDLYAEFEVGQGSVDLLGKFAVRQEAIVDLLGEFDFRHKASVNLLGEFITGQETSVDLFGEFTVRHEASIELRIFFVVGQGINDLRALFCIPTSYDFSKSLGISFYWWGSGGLDQQIDFEMQSPTGSWVGKFYDGPAEWRWVFLSWDDLAEVDIDGTRPNSSQITGIFWIYHTPGVRRVDGIQAWMRQDLPARFVVGQGSSEVFARFVV